MDPTPLPATAAQILDALPPQWQAQANLVMQVAVLLVVGGHFVANNGGLKGLALAIWQGKPKPPPQN